MPHLSCTVVDLRTPVRSHSVPPVNWTRQPIVQLGVRGSPQTRRAGTIVIDRLSQAKKKCMPPATGKRKKTEAVQVQINIIPKLEKSHLQDDGTRFPLCPLVATDKVFTLARYRWTVPLAKGIFVLEINQKCPWEGILKVTSLTGT